MPYRSMVSPVTPYFGRVGTIYLFRLSLDLRSILCCQSVSLSVSLLSLSLVVPFSSWLVLIIRIIELIPLWFLDTLILQPQRLGSTSCLAVTVISALYILSIWLILWLYSRSIIFMGYLCIIISIMYLAEEILINMCIVLHICCLVWIILRFSIEKALLVDITCCKWIFLIAPSCHNASACACAD